MAVACGHSLVELAGDVARSIRIPAAFCGVFGMQGTYGRVPTTLWNESLSRLRSDVEDLLESLPAPPIDAPHLISVIRMFSKP